MKKLVSAILCFSLLRSSGQTFYFIDGYHGGIYGHLPSWQTRFMVDKLAEYPGWKINLELEPESWDSIALSDPSSYTAFRGLLADQSSKGRIEYVNPAYGQSYLYNISGESIIRQFYYGMQKLRRHFPGMIFSTYASEEPCFTSALPQLLRSYGFKYASLKNPNTCWGGYTRAFGGELVNWVGPDGSSILTVPRYAIESLKPRSVWETIASSNSPGYVRSALNAGITHPVGMCLQDAGWTNGPWLKEGGYQPSVYETWRGYIENRSNAGTDKSWHFSQEDVLVGLMWGAQVLQRIARAVRSSENEMIRTEKIAALAGAWKGAAWPEDRFAAAWRTLMLSQHHDCWIVPYNGKPGDTWADKVARWTDYTNAVCDSIAKLDLQILSDEQGKGDYVRVYNTTAAPRKEYVRYGDRLFLASVPPMGYTTCKLDTIKPLRSGASVRRLENGDYSIETDLYKITIDPAKGGRISSWVAKQLGNKEFVEAGKGLNELKGNFYNDGGMRSGAEAAAEVRILEEGPEEIKVGIRGLIAGHPFTQDLTVRQGQRRVDLHLKIDWKDNTAIGEYFEVPKNEEVRKAYYDDRFKLLALFPLNLSSQKVYKNAPFDVCESKLDNTFYNRWDSIKNNVLLNWVDVVDGAGEYGMALFCDHTTSYAHGRDFPLALTIQYSGNGIFYRDYRINGPSELNYALIPHAGKWDRAGIWTEGTKWSEPLLVTAAGAGGERSLLQTVEGVEFSSLTMSGKDLTVRVFNAEATTPVLPVYLGFETMRAVEVELDGRRIRELPIRKDRKGRRWIELSIPRFGIRTIKFEHV